MSPSDDAIQRGLYPSLARILDRAGNIVGGAFLVTDRELITCAHVVNLALGFSPSATEQPSAELEISFVNHPTAIPTSARILDWHPIGDTVEDIAILQLTHPAGPKVRPAVIVQ